jgi:hypothetical protein
LSFQLIENNLPGFRCLRSRFHSETEGRMRRARRTRICGHWGRESAARVGRNKLYEVPTVSCRFPAYIYVPYYDPLVVFGPPGPGFFRGAAIRWGPAVIITGGFFSFGWAYPYFVWGAHAIYFDRTPWSRVWVNRAYYVHPYAHPWVVRPGPRVEVHPIVHRR